MKVRQFLYRFLYAASSIHFVYLTDQVGHEQQVHSGILVNPMSKEWSMEALDKTVRSFQIRDDKLVIYHS